MSDYTRGPKGTLVTGMTRSGKTSFLIAYMLNVACACRFVFDADGQVAARLRVRGAFTASELEAALANRWVIFDPRRMFANGDMQAAFEFFCTWVFDASCRGPGDKVFLVDEVWKYCSPNSIPEPLAKVAQTGSVEGIELALATQLPHKLPASVTQGITEVVAFRQEAHLCLDILETEYFMPRDEIRTLPRGHFIARNRISEETLRGKLW